MPTIIHTYTNASGNESVPAGATSGVLELVGPGAGGGFDNTTGPGGGGGAGAYVKKTITPAVNDATIYTYSIGNPGTGSSGSGATNGGETIISGGSLIMRSNGGTGTQGPTAGGDFSGPNAAGTGGTGYCSPAADSTVNGASGTSNSTGTGGAAGGTLGGAGGVGQVGSPGGVGGNYGGGGGGTDTAPGGAGGPGVVRFTWTTINLPSIPGGLSWIASTLTAITIGWNFSSAGTNAIASYNVYDGASLVGNVGSGVNTFTHNSLSTGTYHNYTVQAVDTAGFLSGPQTAIRCATLTSSTIPLPTAGPPQQREWEQWATRDYTIPGFFRLPAAPPFNKWVPAPEQFAFGEAPRDMSRYQDFRKTITLGTPPPTPPPPNPNLAPQQNARESWNLRDYNPNQDRFSIFALPKLPPKNPSLAPQQNARPEWSLRDYDAKQPWLAAFYGQAPSPWVPAPEQFGFGELPRDMTALMSSLRVTAPIATPAVALQWVPSPEQFAFGELPPDKTAARFIIDRQNIVNPGIPVVPMAEAFASFEYEPIDMTPYIMAATVNKIPPPRLPQIPPSSIPYIEPPGWTLNQYQALQDTFSARATPTKIPYPIGVRSQFTLEALIRDPTPRTIQPDVFFPRGTPPKVPSGVRSDPPAVYSSYWNLRDYRAHQADGAPWIRLAPVLPPPWVVPPVPPLPPTVLVAKGSLFGGRVIINAKKVGETTGVQMDFISLLAPTATIASAVVNCSVYTGNDSSPSSMVFGAASISGTIVTQTITGGVVGTIYILVYQATTSDNQVLEIAAYLAVEADVP